MQSLTKLEKSAIEGLLSLNPTPASNCRDLRALDDWNGASRVAGGVGVATSRLRNRLHNAVRHAHAATATAAPNET